MLSVKFYSFIFKHWEESLQRIANEQDLYQGKK